MKNVLIASVGRSPIVVTAMVKALEKIKNIIIDQLVLLYPEKQVDILSGIELIEKHCICRDIEQYGLPFQDADSSEQCLFFLQTLYGVLEENTANDIHISLAGGRKSMAAMMFLPTPFYENIKGIYHILDKNEGTGSTNFHALDRLIEKFLIEDPKLSEVMNPPIENLSLIELPFGHFADANNLRNVIASTDFTNENDSVPVLLENLAPDALNFWQTIFQKREAKKEFDIWFSANAKNQFESGHIDQNNFSRYFETSKLKEPAWANKSGKNGGKHCSCRGQSGKDSFHGAKISSTAERVIWFQDESERIVIAELGVENDNKNYQRVSGRAILDKDFFSKKSHSDYKPEFQLHDLSYYSNSILVATLGKNPMVITQACILLENLEHVKIETIVIVFPEKNHDICNSVSLLEKVCKRRNIRIVRFGVSVDDLDDNEKCKIFLKHMVDAVEEIKKSYPDPELRMLLSGGRKGMTALSLLAAQQSNISEIYHTLITNPVLEEKIEKHSKLQNIQRLKSTKEKAKLLFLDDYINDLNKNFAIFQVPVIPLKIM